MKIISLIGQKGGTGKTKLAQLLAVAFERDGTPTAGIDLDQQTSFCSWADLREAETPEVIHTPESRLSKTLDTARENGFGLCVIDTAGRAKSDAAAAAQVADLVIIPVQPTPDDLMTVEGSQGLLMAAGKPAAFAVLTRVKAQGTRHEEARQFIENLGLEVCPVRIGERVTYQDAGAAGLSPQEYEPSSKAAEESAALFEFVKLRLEEVTA